MKRLRMLCALPLFVSACQHAAVPKNDVPRKAASIEERLARYATVRLTADLSALSDRERRMLPLLIEAAEHMEAIFWQEAYGDRNALLAKIEDDKARRFAEINFGPWDRLDGNEPFVAGIGQKPEGAGFYPSDLSKAEFESYLAKHPEDAERLKSQYTVVKRSGERLVAEDYHAAFAEHTLAAAAKLDAAAKLADDAGLARYLGLRAEALRSSQYRESDIAWLDMKTNGLDVVIGPIENYEDRLFGYKAAHEAYVLVKDRAWSARLTRYAALLPDLQKGLPVPETYRREVPGSDSDLNAYDVVYYAGDCNAGSKTIAINLPNDETVQLQKGTRRLQLKNAIRAKFDRILVPIAEALIAEDQRKHITFDAFFDTIMFHEVAHGLGIKETINAKGQVREALKDQAAALEEGKADILGLHMIAELHKRGEIKGALEDHYVTFLAGILRSVRFGAASAHGQANMLRFNFFEEMGAFTRDDASGRYRVNFDRIEAAVRALSARILTLQGDGEYEATKALMAEKGQLGPVLENDLARLAGLGIPVDVVFEQGRAVLGL